MDDTTIEQDVPVFAALIEAAWSRTYEAPYLSRARCTDDLLDLHNVTPEPGVRHEVLAIVAGLSGRSLVTAVEMRSMLTAVGAAAAIEGAFARFVVPMYGPEAVRHDEAA